MADRERFKEWLIQQHFGSAPPSGKPRPECIGGPVDGMRSEFAVSVGRLDGASLFVPALLVLTGPLGERWMLEHHYARDSRGNYAYVGTARVR